MKRVQINPIKFWVNELEFQTANCATAEEIAAAAQRLKAKATKSVIAELTLAIDEALEEILSEDYYTVFKGGFTQGTFTRFQETEAKQLADESYAEAENLEDVWVDTVRGDTIYELLADITATDPDFDVPEHVVDDQT